MTESSFETKLKDLNLTNDEIKRFSDAFKNEEFRKLFMEYAQELNDPANRELYESEIRAVEEQRGSDVTFVHPKPGHVLKTVIDGKTKCFINIASNEHIDKPSFSKSDGASGKKGVHWSLPHCLAGPHEDVDHHSKTCTVYDVIFSPDTYRMAETNAKFMKMVEDSALESIENNYHCKLDRNNVKRLKMTFKGVPKATIIRRKKEGSDTAEERLKQETDDVIEKAITNAQNHKVVLSSHNRCVNPSAISNTNSSNANEQSSTDENGFTIPVYRIVHRGEFDMEDCTNSLVPQVRSMRPKQLIVEIDLPLCASTSNVDLDVCERTLKLHCDSPKYSLELNLPYPVRESDSHARFDKKQRKLFVTLAVIKEKPSIIEVETTIDMEETKEDNNDSMSNTEVSTSTLDEIQNVDEIQEAENITFTSIPYEYKQGSAHLAFVLYVKNADKTSFHIENDGQHVSIRLKSLGSGCFPLHHRIFLDFADPMTFETGENSSTITFNDTNVLVLLKKTSNGKKITEFSSGVSRDDMKMHCFSDINPNEKSTSLTQSMKKEDFLKEPSNTSTSTDNDQNKKLSKKQARKLAKENRKNQGTHDVNNKIVNKISKITLEPKQDDHRSESTEDDDGKPNFEEKDDNVSDIRQINPRTASYRRHMSESHVYSHSTSNGEFKLKGILKNSTKYRSYSESLSDPSHNMPSEFNNEEPVFDSCPPGDDLTSSNENNSIITSPDSNGSSSLCTTPGSSSNVKHVTFNNEVSRKTFKPGGPVSGMRKLSSNQQRKLKKRKRQDSLNSQSSDQDDTHMDKNKTNQTNNYKNPVDFQDVLAWQAKGTSETKTAENNATDSATKSAVRFTNPLIFELDN